MATIAKDADIHVSFEDQQKINKFARQNAQLNDLTEQLKAKEKELQDLEDAEGDLLLTKEDEEIPYRMGEVFMYLSVEEITHLMEERKDALHQEVSELRDQQDSVKQVMSDLKVSLYAKFGNNINLEADDS